MGWARITLTPILVQEEALMGRYVTPAGVVIEMRESAACAVGYQPETAEQKPSELAKKKPGRPKKSD